MILAKVVGTVVTTISHPHYKNRRLLLVQPLVTEGESSEEDFIAIDNTHAGIGRHCACQPRRKRARQVLNNPDACIISVIVDCGFSDHQLTLRLQQQKSGYARVDWSMALTCHPTRRLENGLPVDGVYTCRVSKTLRSHKPTYATRRAN